MAGPQKNQKQYNKLVIVESPAKAKTIEKFLGAGYKVTASNGHLIDLPKSKIGVDVENNYEPNYIVIRGKTSLLNAIKKEAAVAEQVFLATDPDREGEAISWHIANALKIDSHKKCRIEFNEITKNAVLKAIENPREIDINRVNAQQARRVLDRLVGYKLSPLLWSKVRRGLSAGRVQSVTVRLIVDREREIREFVPEEYWTITAMLFGKNETTLFESKFIGKNNKKFIPKNEQETNSILADIKGIPFTVKSTKQSTKQRRPYAPFTTSTLQQDAARKLGYTAKRTMMLAQGLYEGIVLKNETVGLITYMRTDSTRISSDAIADARNYIEKEYGSDYVPEKPNVYTSKKNAQDAHEAIRPTNIQYTPDSIRTHLTADQYKLYSLIYFRFLASQMKPARYQSLVCEIEAGAYQFRSTFSKMHFAGYRIVYKESADTEETENNSLPTLKEGDQCSVKEIVPKQNFTSPPQRFTEASLIKMLEEGGIGRPSTYAPIISTIIDRQYVERVQRNLQPTQLGEIVTDLMIGNFSEIVNVEFTADMEEQLDDVETKGEDWKALLSDFYSPFEKQLEKAHKEIEHVKLPERPAGITCEKCGAEMVYKTGRFGEFIACPNYPECKNTMAVKNTIKTPCPLCGEAVVQKKTKKGKTFFGCDSYPNCNFISWDMPIEEKCSKCGSYMVLRKTKNNSTFKKCSNAECETNLKKKTSTNTKDETSEGK